MGNGKTNAMKTVRAKFTCTSVSDERYEHHKQTKITLHPVTSGPFWEATPSGRLELDICNEVAAKFFEPGKTYYLDFSAAEDEGD